jgi:Domain of unknown function (DUF1905)
MKPKPPVQTEDETWNFSGKVWYWRGPSPFHFITIPTELCAEISEVSASVTYGWGMVPVTARCGNTEFTTSLFPKNGAYILPIKSSVRVAEHLDVDNVIEVQFTITSRA